jgi:FixJ family two-component response regulator
MRDNPGVMMRIIPVRALVIDDDDSVCRKVSAWLRDAGCDVVAFTRPAEGIDHAQRAACQVGLVDLRLAGVDGPGVIATLRQAAPTMRIVAMSAFPDVPQVVAAMRAGARDLLEKPIQQPALLEAVERQLTELGLGIRSEPEFNRRLGARLRAVRTHVQRTLPEVAEACGLTVSRLSQIELGKTGTTLWALARICSALRTPLDKLLADL